VAADTSDLHALMLAMRDELRRTQDALRAGLRAMMASLEREDVKPSSSADQRSIAELREYQQLVGRVREIVQRTIPCGATVAMVNKGDEQLLDLDGRQGWHFPRTPDGIYAGHYPADTAEAISQVDAVRAAGADYVLFPATAFWWLDHYPGLRKHLQHCHQLTYRDDACAIFALCATAATDQWEEHAVEGQRRDRGDSGNCS
jgi:hypothetical protein